MKSSFCLLLLWCLALSAIAQSPTLRLHPANPHYFEYQGKPTVLITSAEHYGAVLNPDFDYKIYLDELAHHGLNYTRIFTGAYIEAPDAGDFGIEKNTLGPKAGRFLAPWKRSNQAGYFYGGNKFDLDQWDDAYFARLRAFVALAQRKGIIVEVTMFTSHYSDAGWKSSPLHVMNNVNRVDSVSKTQALTLQNGNVLRYQENMVRKFVQELNGFPNVLFEIQNEPWADNGLKVATLTQTDPVNPEAKSWQQVVELANPDRLAWQQRVASWIVEEEAKLPNRHLIAQNISNFYHKITNPDPQVSVFHFHYAHPEAAAHNQDLNRVIGFDESGFNGTSDDVYRRQAWRWLLSGGGLFNNLDYSFTTAKPKGTDRQKAPGGGSVALRQQLKVLKGFMEQLDFVKLSPKPQVLTGVSVPNARTCVLAHEGQEYAIYFEGGQRLKADLRLPSGNYQEKWLDTRTGKILKSATVSHGGEYFNLSSPFYEGEVVVWLKRQ
jgi:hypothetical protein